MWFSTAYTKQWEVSIQYDRNFPSKQKINAGEGGGSYIEYIENHFLICCTVSTNREKYKTLMLY